MTTNALQFEQGKSINTKLYWLNYRRKEIDSLNNNNTKDYFTSVILVHNCLCSCAEKDFTHRWALWSREADRPLGSLRPLRQRPRE